MVRGDPAARLVTMKRVSTPSGPASTRGDDAFDAVPTGRTIIELLEAPELVGGACGGEPRRRALLQVADMAAQRGRRGDAKRIVHPVGAAEAQHLGRAIVAVAA